MPLLNPSVMQGAFGADDLMTQLRMKKAQEAMAQVNLQDAQRQQAAKALIGRALQQAGVPLPAANPPVPQGGAPAPANGNAPSGGALQPPAGGFPVSGAPSPAADAEQPMPRGQPGAALSAPQEQFAWTSVLDSLRKLTGADPSTVADAVMDIMPEIDKEAMRKDKASQAQAALDQKNYALIQTLQWKYANTASQTERAQIKAEMDRVVAGMKGDTARDVANIGAASRENVATTQGQARVTAAQIAGDSRTNIANATNALRKELGEDTLKLRADQLKDTNTYRERVLDLREKGLDQQAAQAQAKLEQQKALAEMRDETTKRGQDMISKDKAAAIAAATARMQAGQQFKIDTARGKAAVGLSGAIDDMDGLSSDIDKLLAMPGFDGAFGVIRSHMPTVQQDTANAEAALDSIRARKMVALVQRMKQLAPNGSSGFGRITNYEAQTLQNAIASLSTKQSPEQARESLTQLKDYLSLSKMHMTQAYEQEYGPAGAKPGTAAPPANAQAVPGGKSISIPATVPKGAMKQVDGKWYQSNGDGTASEVK